MPYKIMLYTNKKETQIGTVNSKKEMVKFIANYLNEINYKSYYIRYRGSNPMIVDFGEYNTFFHVYEA